MEILLQRGELLGLDGDPRRLEIDCRSGRLWITQSGDGRDHLLTPGKRFAVLGRGRVVIVALQAAALTIEVPVGRQAPRLASCRTPLLPTGKAA